MKYTLLFLFISINALSQRISINKIDEFTDEKIIKTDASIGSNWSGSDNIAKGIFNYVFLSNKYIEGNHKKITTTLQITVGTMICVSPNNGAIILLLEDNSKIQFNQTSKIDCQTNAIIVDYSAGDTFEDQLFNFKKLSTIKINKIRIYTTDSVIDLEIKDKKKEIIKETFQLLLTNIR